MLLSGVMIVLFVTFTESGLVNSLFAFLDLCPKSISLRFRFKLVFVLRP